VLTNNLYKIPSSVTRFLEVSTWLSVAFAVRALPLDITFPTQTVRPTEPGSPTSARLRQLLTALTAPFTFAPVAFVPERLSVHKGKKLRKQAEFFVIVNYDLFS